MFLCFEADELNKTKLTELYSPANKNYYPDRIISNPGGGGGGGDGLSCDRGGEARRLA